MSGDSDQEMVGRIASIVNQRIDRSTSVVNLDPKHLLWLPDELWEFYSSRKQFLDETADLRPAVQMTRFYQSLGKAHDDVVDKFIQRVINDTIANPACECHAQIVKVDDGLKMPSSAVDDWILTAELRQIFTGTRFARE